MLRQVRKNVPLPQVAARIPYHYVEHAKIKVKDSTLEVWDQQEGSINVSPLTFTLILLGPGTSVTHEAVKLVADCGCCLAWVGRDGFRFYASGRGTARTDMLLLQAQLATNQRKREQVARRMFRYRFNEIAKGKSIEELRGMEGARVRARYQHWANHYGVVWAGRNYDRNEWDKTDQLNQYICQLNAAFYALVNSVILAMGYSPDLGFIHTGIPRAFTLDVADLYKTEVSIKAAFAAEQVKSKGGPTQPYGHLNRELQEQAVISKITKDLSNLIK